MLQSTLPPHVHGTCVQLLCTSGRGSDQPAASPPWMPTCAGSIHINGMQLCRQCGQWQLCLLV